ncbi:MAG: hypothetical protein ACI9LE_000826 [Paraglaciecola sp.]|jgi:hypothetical protein
MSEKFLMTVLCQKGLYESRASSLEKQKLKNCKAQSLLVFFSRISPLESALYHITHFKYRQVHGDNQATNHYAQYSHNHWL